MTSPWFAAVGWALLIAGSVVLVRRARGMSAASIVLPLIVLPTVVLIVVSAVGTPIYTPRYLSMCLPFVALAIAAALDAIRPRAVTAGALVLIAALAVPQVVEQRQPEAKELSSWSAVADLIARERAADGPDATTAIVYGNVKGHPIASTRVIAYSYPDAFAGTIDVNIGIPAAQTGQLWESRIPLAEGLERLKGADVTYLVTSETRDRRPGVTALLDEAGWHLAEEWKVGAVNVLRYERD
jgi:mannosyltransferase